MLSQGGVLVMETDSRSESSDFIEEDTEELSPEESSSDYDTDSDIDLENSGYDIATNPVNQALPTDDDADENDSAWTLLVLNESGDFDFQFNGSECGTKHIGNAKKPADFFNLIFKPVLWRILVEETNPYAKTHNTSNWKYVITAEMKVSSLLCSIWA